MLAELLDWPSVSSVSDFDIEGNVAKLTREIDGGKERVSCTFPLVATGQKGIAKEPRIPSMKGIMFSRRKAIAVVTAVDCKKFTVVLNHELPPAKAKCKIIPADKPEELARLLHEEAKVI
jgi:electron transfer flavoprotein beta subunit